MPFFSYESKFSQIMLRICYSCWLNLLWFICSLPVFTIGAATTALYYVTLKLAKDEEGDVTKMFFRSFKENFKQATVLWLIMFFAGLFLAADGYILYHLRLNATGAAAIAFTLMLAVIIGAAVMYTIILIYIFPLQASVTNTTWAMLKNSFLIGTHYLFCTIVVFGIHFLLFVIIVRFFTPLIIMGEGLAAMLSSLLLWRVIAICSYDPGEETE